jgi:hypothetical protein
MAVREFFGELDDEGDGGFEATRAKPGLASVRRGKEGVKLAGGGFLGGNLGIALGAGVQEMNRQRQLDRMEADQRLAKEVAAAASGVKQEQVTAYTEDQGARLNAIANAKNPQTGAPYFNVEHDGSKYVVKEAPASFGFGDPSPQVAKDAQPATANGIGFEPAESPTKSPGFGQSGSDSAPLDGLSFGSGQSNSPTNTSDFATPLQKDIAKIKARRQERLAQEMAPNIPDSTPKMDIGNEVRNYLDRRKEDSYEVAPATQYKLGSQVQDKPFSDADISNERLARMSEAFVLAGRPEKAGQVEVLLEKRRKTAEETRHRAALAKAGEGGVENLLKTAPDVAFEYIKSGDVTKAKAFMDFADSMDGKEYARRFAKAHHLTTIGDYEGAAPLFEELYNARFPDGREVKLNNLGNGQYRADFIDQKTGGIVDSKELPVSQLARDAVSALSPTKLVEHLVTQNAKRDSEGALLDRQVHIEDIRQRGREFSEDRRDQRLARRLESAAQGKNLTLSQQAHNFEIEAARKRISGMSAEDIRLKTAPTTATGRENPSYDPLLARDAKLASKRKVGTDDLFDSRMSPQEGSGEPATSPISSDAPTRFKADRAMSGYRMGKETPSGFEVFDSTGKLVGHWE